MQCVGKPLVLLLKHITEKFLYFLPLTHWIGVPPAPLAGVICIFTLQFGLHYVIILM